MDEDVFPDPYGIVLQNGQIYNSAIIIIASSKCSLLIILPDCTTILYQVFSFGRARDADVTLILFIRPHFVTFICLYAHNG